MADFTAIGHINNIKFVHDSIYITLDEYEKGYVKGNGEKVGDKIFTWKVIINGTQAKRNYINKFFSRGSYVQIKGKLYPYELINGEKQDGYTVFVQSINLMCYPKRFMKIEREMIKESQTNAKETPDLEGYMQEDF